jgi:ribulose-5-phosphate 4-epimerase/fuculose-1-phosphate aldolase
MMWDAIEPSDIVSASKNCTADIIHSAVYKVRPDVKAIIHLHTKYAAAVCCIEGGFIPLTQVRGEWARSERESRVLLLTNALFPRHALLAAGRLILLQQSGNS